LALCGVPPAALALAASRILDQTGARVALLACPNLGRAEGIAEEIPFFAGNTGAAHTSPPGQGAAPPSPPPPPPVIRALPPPAIAGAAPGAGTEFDTSCDLLNALDALKHAASNAAPLVLACSPDALAQPCPPPGAFEGRELTLRAGLALPLRELSENLVRFGYYNEVLCETPGQFAMRGGLVDIYPLNTSAPIRVDFLGDEIESIRTFDPATQRSDATLDGEVRIVAATITEAGRTESKPRANAFAEHLPPGVLWIIAEPETFSGAQLGLLAESVRKDSRMAVITEFDTPPDWCMGRGEPGSKAGKPPRHPGAPPQIIHWEGRDLAALHPAPGDPASTTADPLLGVDRLSAEEAARAGLLRELARRQGEGAVVQIVVATPGAWERLREILSAAKLESGGRAFAPEIRLGTLSAGFALERHAPGAPPFLVATEHELFGHRRRLPSIRQRRMPRKSRVEQLLDFSEIAEGDHLVHLQHGVCIYRGINPINGEEMISLEFDEHITTHIPLREAHLVSRYVGLRKATPKLGKIGSNAWAKTRRAAETATVDFAARLLAQHANRHSRPGIAFPRSSEQPWLREMEATFPYRETPDQARAITETLADMEKPSPMDRLICGDVGFGKTEVALRAVFKAVLAGKQAAILAPTTVLAQQHFNTFRERLAKYPVSIEMLSRFREPAQRTKIIGQINDGRLDIVVGTHALLAPGIKFPRLGLLVIDEEHRFGVGQKEAIQHLRSEVDILCMSATPIPRTLYLALQGARELSVIETPPRERLPIRTLVRAYDLKLIQDAIRYEVGRGGQVFYLHNRIEDIAQTTLRLGELMPDIRFATGHGQMPEGRLEEIMTDFVAGRHDVLVCTTIIETGLDIPNCNTLIIEGADRFGLAQLYQLRGRVGRFNRQAYAYLLLHKHALLLDPARKRLSAIRQHNQLGAGLRIAMRDLELRGVGNLLGREQSGHIAGVGFELYCQLLRQSIARLKGDPLASTIRCELRLDFVETQGLVNVEAGKAPPEDFAPTDPEPLFDDELPSGPKHPGGTAGPSSGHGFRVLRDEELAAERTTTPITATIAPAYISDTRLRIDFYRRLALAQTPGAVHEIASDMRDRFGEPPPAASATIALAEIRTIAESRGIASIETEGQRLKCRLALPPKNSPPYLKIGANFPRLTSRRPLQRLKEIRTFLLRQPAAVNQ
jgi:transcription-repair coupling factor (superfamily II helicase)